MTGVVARDLFETNDAMLHGLVHSSCGNTTGRHIVTKVATRVHMHRSQPNYGPASPATNETYVCCQSNLYYIMQQTRETLN